MNHENQLYASLLLEQHTPGSLELGSSEVRNSSFPRQCKGEDVANLSGTEI